MSSTNSSRPNEGSQETKIQHWIYLVCAFGQVLVFGVSYLLLSVIIQSGTDVRFSMGAERHFIATLSLFTLGTAFQWLVISMLKGMFSKGVAALNLLLLTFIVFHRARLYNSLLLLACSFMSVIIILVLFQRIQQADPPEPAEESDVLDDSW